MYTKLFTRRAQKQIDWNRFDSTRGCKCLDSSRAKWKSQHSEAYSVDIRLRSDIITLGSLYLDWLYISLRNICCRTISGFIIRRSKNVRIKGYLYFKNNRLKLSLMQTHSFLISRNNVALLSDMYVIMKSGLLTSVQHARPKSKF